jgi:truncated hemoglobin YjbI
MRKHILTDNGQVLLGEQMTTAEVDQLAVRLFTNIGGAAFFHRLASRFYELVAEDPVIGPMFHEPPQRHARRLAEHYIRMYGKPDLSEGWDPRFLRAHLNVVIGHRHRQRWLDLLRQAGEEIGAEDPWFSDFIGAMTNGSSAVTAASRAAALVRGIRIDRQGEVIQPRKSATGEEA